MPHQKNPGLFEKVYKIVRTIPEGKVATYGQLAKMLGIRDVRKIGWALHGNRDPKTPCHRVVNKEGAVAVNYGAFLSKGQPSQNRSSRRERIVLKSREGRLGGGGGWKEQKMRLLSEGVEFKDEMHVDLEKYLWTPK